MTNKPSSLTLADLEAVEKAGGEVARMRATPCMPEESTAAWITLEDAKTVYHDLAASHAVEMGRALTEALEAIESVRRYRDRMWRTEQHTGWLEWHTLLNKFHENWPGLLSEKSDSGGEE